MYSDEVVLTACWAGLIYNRKTIGPNTCLCGTQYSFLMLMKMKYL